MPTSMTQLLSAYFDISLTQLFVNNFDKLPVVKKPKDFLPDKNVTILNQRNDGFKQVPLINWIRAGAWPEIATDFEANEYYPQTSKAHISHIKN